MPVAGRGNPNGKKLDACGFQEDRQAVKLPCRYALEGKLRAIPLT